jgi:sugar lactone lactonase YvrE
LSQVQQFVASRLFEPESEALRFLPEGPRVLRQAGLPGSWLGWVAIQDSAEARVGSLNLLDLSTRENRSFPLPGRPGFFAETAAEGVVLVGMERRLVTFDWRSGEVRETGVVVSEDERVIINDGLAVEGGVLFGTKHLGFSEAIAAVYFYDWASGRVHQVLDGQVCSNGKYLRRDAAGATLIDIDSMPKAISRYRLDAGLERVLERSLVVAPESLPGFPDGLRPSPDGESVIVAFYNPEPVSDGVARMYRLADGAVECEWILPGSPRVTCPELVEMDGKVKIVFTTAVEGMPAAIRAMAPGAGAIYLADTPF